MLLLCGCMKESYVPYSFHQRLVVDGRIENGRSAVVMLSITHPYNEQINIEELRDMVVRWAKVTVSSSTQSEVLTGRVDRNYPTQFIYTGSDIVGEVGETYSIRIDYSDHVWTATTTIPNPTTFENIELESINEEHFTINATIVPATDKSPYMTEIANLGSSYFVPSFAGIYNATDAPQEVSIMPHIDMLTVRDYQAFFNKEDALVVRISTMPNETYSFWSHWQNNILNSFNPIFPPQSNPPSNFTGDALGIWSGYGCTYYEIEYGKEVVRLN